MDLASQIKFRFKLSGFQIRGEACSFLKENLEPLSSEERDQWLDTILDFVQKQPLQSPSIEKSVIEAAISDISKLDVDSEEDVLNVISAFEVPRFKYLVDRKKFVPVENKVFEIYAPAAEKAAMFKERYNIIYQRVLRNKLFSSMDEDSATSGQFKLRSIEFIISINSKIDCVVILGMISQLKEGKYYLEDPTGYVEVDLSEAVFHDGLFTENCFVLADGRYEDQVLYIKAIGMPPKERSELSRVYYGTFNSFGGPSKVSLRHDERLKRIEESKNLMMIFIADVWLDDPMTLEKLKVLFSGYAEEAPVFVLMGNFLGGQKGSQHLSGLREGFKRLGEIIGGFPKLVTESKWVLVPGPGDLPSASVLPRPGLPDLLVQGLSSLRDLTLATNPVRIQYCTQEIVALREDIVTKVCRNTLNFPRREELSSHLAKTLICQGTLVPLPPTVCPTYWSFHPSLQLYPTPDFLLVADQMLPFSTSFNGTRVVNPGSFSRGKFIFSSYYPATKETEYCQIKDDQT